MFNYEDTMPESNVYYIQVIIVIKFGLQIDRKLIACHFICNEFRGNWRILFWSVLRDHLEDPHHHFLISHHYPSALMKN